MLGKPNTRIGRTYSAAVLLAQSGPLLLHKAQSFKHLMQKRKCPAKQLDAQLVFRLDSNL